MAVLYIYNEFDDIYKSSALRIYMYNAGARFPVGESHGWRAEGSEKLYYRPPARAQRPRLSARRRVRI